MYRSNSIGVRAFADPMTETGSILVEPVARDAKEMATVIVIVMIGVLLKKFVPILSPSGWKPLCCRRTTSQAWKLMGKQPTFSLKPGTRNTGYRDCLLPRGLVHHFSH